MNKNVEIILEEISKFKRFLNTLRTVNRYARFKFKKDRVVIRELNMSQTVLFETQLYHDFFDAYIVKEPVEVTLDVDKFYKALSDVTNKDTVYLNLDNRFYINKIKNPDVDDNVESISLQLIEDMVEEAPELPSNIFEDPVKVEVPLNRLKRTLIDLKKYIDEENPYKHVSFYIEDGDLYVNVNKDADPNNRIKIEPNWIVTDETRATCQYPFIRIVDKLIGFGSDVELFLEYEKPIIARVRANSGYVDLTIAPLIEIE